MGNGPFFPRFIKEKALKNVPLCTSSEVETTNLRFFERNLANRGRRTLSPPFFFHFPPLVPERSRALSQWRLHFPRFFLFALFFRGVLCPKDGGGVGARVRLRCFRGIRRRYGACMRRSGVSPAAGRTAAGSRRSWRA